MNKYRAPHEAFWGVVAQGIGFILGSITLFLSREILSAVSFGLGFLVSLLPTCVFYLLYFRRQGAQYLQAIRNRFYIGEMVKLVLTVAMFALVWQISWIEPGWVFFGYGMSLLCFFLPPIGISFKQANKSKVS